MPLILPLWQKLQQNVGSSRECEKPHLTGCAHHLQVTTLAKKPTCSGARFGLWQVWRIGMDIHNYVWCLEVHIGIQVSSKIIKCLKCLFHHAISAFCLLAGNCWVPLALSCQPLLHNTECFPQFSEPALFWCCWVCASCWVGGEIGPPIHFLGSGK